MRLMISLLLLVGCEASSSELPTTRIVANSPAMIECAYSVKVICVAVNLRQSPLAEQVRRDVEAMLDGIAYARAMPIRRNRPIAPR